VPLRQIARLIGVERKTIRRWLRTGHPPTWRKPPRPRMLDHFSDYLEQRWADGCRNAAQLWREMVARGFPGRPSIVRTWAGQRRKTDPDPNPLPRDAAGGVWKPPYGRDVVRLIMAEVTCLSAVDRAFVTQLLQSEPELSAVVALAKRFQQALGCKAPFDVETWLGEAKGSALVGFAQGIESDAEAVSAAFSEPWSTSPVEGHINRLKTIKRSMYGRASYDLLRQRILTAA
jgi:transposase